MARVSTRLPTFSAENIESEGLLLLVALLYYILPLLYFMFVCMYVYRVFLTPAPIQSSPRKDAINLTQLSYLHWSLSR